MKFEKFVKQLGGSGVIQIRPDESKWLASSSAVLRIPDTMSGVIAESIVDMPVSINTILSKEMTGTPASLKTAIMPSGDAAIKDCIRVYVADNDPSVKLPISNDDFSLIDLRRDQVEILTLYDLAKEEIFPVALLVKKFYLPDEYELDGVIFPIPDAVGNI